MPYSMQQPYGRIFDAPVVVVGVIVSDTDEGRTAPCKRGADCPMQLHRLNVRIENILRGSLETGEVAVYYFMFASAFSSPGPPLGQWGEVHRRILWLRRGSGVLRLACDGHNYCAMPVSCRPAAVERTIASRLAILAPVLVRAAK